MYREILKENNVIFIYTGIFKIPFLKLVTVFTSWVILFHSLLLFFSLYYFWSSCFWCHWNLDLLILISPFSWSAFFFFFFSAYNHQFMDVVFFQIFLRSSIESCLDLEIFSAILWISSFLLLWNLPAVLWFLLGAKLPSSYSICPNIVSLFDQAIVI